ncbi:hypothetical protein T4D_662 [Trichinella pseudospiralis]|uniref:Uncharacterized protein n=1 Tax=Trichinella pseudospiralis TaxID=6337 RepID=A0A0V1G4R0_TRIPS|nr:hypothetical protein T4D_662 [Trichinella pseudospiralis]
MLIYYAQLQNLSFISIDVLLSYIALNMPYRENKARLASRKQRIQKLMPVVSMKNILRKLLTVEIDS